MSADWEKEIHGSEAFHVASAAYVAEQHRLGVYFLSKGWIQSGPGWIDPLAFEQEGFFAPILGSQDAFRIQRWRDAEEALLRPEVQRARLLSVLSARKKGPVPLERIRSGFLFLLERRAIRLIEDE